MSNSDMEDEDNIVQLREFPAGLFPLLHGPKETSVEDDAFGTEWWEMDQIFKFYRGQFVVVTGIAGHGKSTFVLNMLCNVAREQDIRSFLYVPENERNLHAKLQGIWNRPEASFNFFAEFQCFYQSAKTDYDQAPHTLEWVLDRAYHAVTRWDCSIVLIDPWNELEHAKPQHMLMTDYIARSLSTIKQFCRQMNVVVIVIAHPTKAVNENGGRTPGLADIEGCYSDDTEVLTRRGWLHHGQMTLSDDVACFDPKTSSVVYHQPSNILRKEFDGDLYRFTGLGYDLAVTPQHRMLVQPVWNDPVGGGKVTYQKGKWSFCRAQDLPGSSFKIPLSGAPIAGANPETICIGDRVYPARAFWRLAGWFVAEGYVGPTGLVWAQAEGELAESFTATFAEAGIPATVGWQQPHGKGKQVVGRWYIGNRFCPLLVNWFAQHCGVGAVNKHIPAAVFDLSPELKGEFFAAYLQGDGSQDGRSATTISPRLRDDLQRLAVEMGIPTSYGRRASEGNNKELFWLRFGTEARRAVALRKSRNASRERYSGLVWCLTVPTGAYFVRRNGCVAVCGNSMNWYNRCDNGLIVVRDKEVGSNSAKVISAKVREYGAGKVGMCHFHVDPKTGLFTPMKGGVSL